MINFLLNLHNLHCIIKIHHKINVWRFYSYFVVVQKDPFARGTMLLLHNAWLDYFVCEIKASSIKHQCLMWPQNFVSHFPEVVNVAILSTVSQRAGLIIHSIPKFHFMVFLWSILCAFYNKRCARVLLLIKYYIYARGEPFSPFSNKIIYVHLYFVFIFITWYIR